MLKRLLTIWLLLSSICFGQILGPTSIRSAGKSPDNKIGMNPGGIKDFDTFWTFADLMRNTNSLANRTSSFLPDSNPEQTAGSGWFVYFRATGPSDVYKLRIRERPSVGGNYELAGTASVTVNGAVVENFTADGDITFAAPITASTVAINSIDPDTVVEIWAPGTAPPPGEDPDDPNYKFHPTYVGLAKKFGIIRNLVFHKINRTNALNNLIQTVADQTPKDTPTQASIKFGCAMEHFLDFCVVCNADAWVCFPHTAQDDFITRWLTLLKAFQDANPGRKVYVEYSNELWNTGFDQCIAPSGSDLEPFAMFTIGESILGVGANFFTKIAVGSGDRGADFFNRVETINASINLDYIETMGWQAGGFGSSDDMINQFKSVRTGGKAPEALAIADYITWRISSIPPRSRSNIVNNAINEVHGSVVSLSSLTQTERDIIDSELVGLTNNVPAIEAWPADRMITLLLNEDIGGGTFDNDHGIAFGKTWLQSYKPYCDLEGMELITYERGQHLQPDFQHNLWLPLWAAQYTIAQQDPRMRKLLDELYRAWETETDNLVQVHLSLIQDPRNNANFGHLNTMFPPDLDNSKWQAIDNLVKRRR